MANINDLLAPIIYMLNDILGNPGAIAGVIFLWVSFIMMLVFIPFEAMVVIWVPLSFVLMIFVPVLRIVVGILLGIIIGIGLLKWIRR